MNEYEYSQRETLSKDKILTFNNLIILINIIIFIIMMFGGNTDSARYLYEKGGAAPDSVINEHEYYRIWTSMFMHSGIRHIFNNMLVLFFMGELLERTAGHIKYLAIYIGSGIIGGVISQLIYYSQGEFYVVCVGASGAIFGVIGAMIYVLIRNRGHVEHLSLSRMILFVILSVYMGLTTTGISLSAHVAGLVTGFIFALILYRKRGFY